ncbi:MAG: galactokinase, partial [Deltaproteobacteria bacterium]|nr:galactokinase [Deltaproteobacteria bacterium]
MTPFDLMESFENIFGPHDLSGQCRLFFAPGRVNLIGEHTDYNGGYVLPCALSLGTYALVAQREDRLCQFFSLNFPDDGLIRFNLDSIWDSKESNWSRYPRAVLAALEERGLSLDRGLDILYYGNLPGGAGLSSSASIEVLTGFAFQKISGQELSPVELALLAQRAENNWVGVK